MTKELQQRIYINALDYRTIHYRMSSLRGSLVRVLTEDEHVAIRDEIKELEVKFNNTNKEVQIVRGELFNSPKYAGSEFTSSLKQGLEATMASCLNAISEKQERLKYLQGVIAKDMKKDKDFWFPLAAEYKKDVERIIRAMPSGDTYEVSYTIIESMKHYLGQRYFEYLPFFYNSFTGKNELEWLKIKDLQPLLVKCLITNKDVPMRVAFKTVYGGFISKEVWDTDELGVRKEYTFCSLNTSLTGRQDTLVKLTDCVTVFNMSNKIELKHVYKETADKQPGWSYNPTNNRYYTFKYLDKPYFVMGIGFVDKHYISKNNCKMEPAFGCYTHGKFRILNKSNNVLDYFDGFKHMPYEEVVSGSKRMEENTLFMGVELEVEMSTKATVDINEAARQSMVAMNKHAITCEDGSLRNGFEIISVPCTLAYHYTIWNDMLRGDLRKQLVSYNSERCGIHVHMSKSAFSELGLGRFAWFINAKENKDFVNHVAQRDTAERSTDYAMKSPTKISKAREMLKTNNYVDAKGNRMGKYSAVNMCRSSTVEVRIFKGTLHYPSVMKNLEFCHALHAYCHTVASNMTKLAHPYLGYSLTYKDFCRWLECSKTGNRKAYPNLFNFLKEAKYVSDKLPSVKVHKTSDIPDDMVAQPQTSTVAIAEALSEEAQAKMRMLTASRAKGLNLERVISKQVYA